MRIGHAGFVATVLVLAVGIGMILPVFFSDARTSDQLDAALIFEVGNSSDTLWCKGVSNTLTREGIRATVFFSGEFAYAHPECVQSFSEGVDVGSQTLSYSNLTSIMDYTAQLGEVIDGKARLDDAGRLDSKVFRAPYGSTDENIYSLLSRAGILADFSYDDHYNIFYEGKFIRINASVYELSQTPAGDLVSSAKELAIRRILVVVNDMSSPEEYTQLIQNLRSAGFHFINASDLAEFEVTTRR